MANKKNQFYLRRLHSLLGVIPIGGFLLVHLLVNHQATQGEAAFNKAAGFMESIPFLIAVEFIVIYIPILYHAVYGVHIAFTAKENVGHYSAFRNWMFLLQRVTGVITFIFVAIHLWQTRIQRALGHDCDESILVNFLHCMFISSNIPLCEWFMVILSYLGCFTI